jgi:hypothetical protein
MVQNNQAKKSYRGPKLMMMRLEFCWGFRFPVHVGIVRINRQEGVGMKAREREAVE